MIKKSGKCFRWTLPANWGLFETGANWFEWTNHSLFVRVEPDFLAVPASVYSLGFCVIWVSHMHGWFFERRILARPHRWLQIPFRLLGGLARRRRQPWGGDGEAFAAGKTALRPFAAQVTSPIEGLPDVEESHCISAQQLDLKRDGLFSFSCKKVTSCDKVHGTRSCTP